MDKIGETILLVLHLSGPLPPVVRQHPAEFCSGAYLVADQLVPISLAKANEIERYRSLLSRAKNKTQNFISTTDFKNTPIDIIGKDGALRCRYDGTFEFWPAAPTK